MRFEIIVYNVFGDESADEKKERVFAVAGIIGREDDWEGVEKEWRKITKGREFHANECERRQNKGLCEKLVGVLLKSRLMGWGAVMSLVDYSRIFEQPVSNLPYYICFQKVIEMFARRTGYFIPQDKVEFTFDRNLETQYNATVLYDYMVKLPEWEHRELVADRIAFSTRKNPKIQAADLWAREVMKFGEEALRTNQPRKRPLLEALEKTRRFGLDFYEASYFEGMKRIITERHLPGHTMNEYHEWRKRYNIQDTMEHRIRYHMFLDLVENERGYNTQFNSFDRAMKAILKVPRSEVKQQLDEEAAKKRKKSKKSSASGRVGDGRA